MAPSALASRGNQCPLIEVKQSPRGHDVTVAFDPNLTYQSPRRSLVNLPVNGKAFVLLGAAAKRSRTLPELDHSRAKPEDITKGSYRGSAAIPRYTSAIPTLTYKKRSTRFGYVDACRQGLRHPQSNEHLDCRDLRWQGPRDRSLAKTRFWISHVFALYCLWLICIALPCDERNVSAEVTIENGGKQLEQYR